MPNSYGRGVVVPGMSGSSAVGMSYIEESAKGVTNVNGVTVTIPVIYCTPYWETEGASQNNHQSVPQCP